MKRLVCCAVLAAAGCTGINFDLDSVALRGADSGVDAGADVAADATVEPDAPADMSGDVATDAGADMTEPPDASVDAGDDADMFVSNCTIPQPVDPERCNPTETGICPGDGLCSLAVVGAPPPQLVCLPRDKEGAGTDGAACTNSDECLEGYACVNWGLNEEDPRGFECTRFCEIETNAGCGAGEFCTKVFALPDLEGIGWCTPECDPYDPDACPSGFTCNVDYNYPVSSCQPRFRCLASTDFVQAGGACGAGRSVTMCAEDLVCYEVQTADFRCVTPCSSDADCAAGTCGAPTGAWNLRFCSL